MQLVCDCLGRKEPELAYFTKYICFYEVDENNTLLINTLTGAIDIIEINFLHMERMVRDKRLIKHYINCESYRRLKKRGYIIDSSLEEQHLLETFKQINQQISRNRSLDSFTICPTMGCNLRCAYCFEDHDVHKLFDTMTTQQLNTIFAYIEENYKNQKKNNKFAPINVFGGEPLLNMNYNLIKMILQFAKKINVPVSIATNGTTLNLEYLELFKMYREHVSLQFTFDGAKGYHDKKRIYSNGNGTFDCICKAIEQTLNSGICVSVRINIHVSSANGIDELEKTFKKRGWLNNPQFYVYAAPVRNYEHDSNIIKSIKDSQMLDILFKKGLYRTEKSSFIKRIDSSVCDIVLNLFKESQFFGRRLNIPYCHAQSGSHLCFAPNGVITTCIRCASKKEYGVGILEKNMITIDTNKLNLWKDRSPFDMKKCQKCKFILLCGGGCPYMALKKYNDINCPVCNDFEETLKIYIKHMRKNLLKYIPSSIGGV